VNAPRLLVMAALLVAAQTVRAADCSQAGNLLTNCGFDVDLAGWDITAADASAHIADDGAFALGSVELDRHDGLEAIEIFSGCVTVTPDTEYDLGVAHRLVVGPFANRCFLEILEYDGSVCDGFLNALAIPFTPVPSWSEVFDRRRVGATTESVQVRLACSYSKNDFVVRLDDFMFGENLFSPVVFNDGFETEYTGVWSSQFP